MYSRGQTFKTKVDFFCAKLLVPQYCIRNHSRLHHPFWWARLWRKRLFQVINSQPFSSEVVYSGFSSLFSCLSMCKKRSLAVAQRAQIVILRQEGYSKRAISERFAVSKTAVHQAVVKFKNCGSYSDCKRSGRPRKTTRREDILIKRYVVKSSTCSAKRFERNLGKLVRKSAEEPSIAD